MVITIDIGDEVAEYERHARVFRWEERPTGMLLSATCICGDWKAWCSTSMTPEQAVKWAARAWREQVFFLRWRLTHA